MNALQSMRRVVRRQSGRGRPDQEGPGERRQAMIRASQRPFPSLVLVAVCGEPSSPARAADDDRRGPGYPGGLCPVRIPGRKVEGAGRAQRQLRSAVSRLGRKARLGLDLRPREAQRALVHDRGGQVPRVRQADVQPARQSSIASKAKSPAPAARRSHSRASSTHRENASCSIASARSQRAEPEADAMQISLRPNANFLRYTMTQDLKPEGAAQFAQSDRSRRDQGGRNLRRGSSRNRTPEVHRDRRPGHDVGHVRRSNFPALLLGLSRRIQ